MANRRNWKEDPVNRDALAGAGGQPRLTPQTEPIPGREADMVRNDAGGYGFQAREWDQLDQFLVLGVTGGTYYIGQDAHMERNLDLLNSCIREDGPRVVKAALEVNTAVPACAPKPNPQIFALASVFVYGDAEAKTHARHVAPLMLRTTDHRSMFTGYYKALHGKTLPGGGRGIRYGKSFVRALKAVFTETPLDDLSWQILKAQQRKTPQGEKMAVADMLRIAHPTPDSEARNALFGWVTGKVSDAEARVKVPALDRYLTAKAVKTPAEAVQVVKELRVPWEFLPDEVLGYPEVWEHLVSTIGTRAVMRNLKRMTMNGAIQPFGSVASGVAIGRLKQADAVAKARIHPMEAWLAQRTYASGQSVRTDARGRVVGEPTVWTPNPDVVDALTATFNAGFDVPLATGKRIIQAVDASGSMSYQQAMANGSQIGSVYQAANTMAMIVAKSEPNVVTIDFDWIGYRGLGHLEGGVFDGKTGVYPSRVKPSTQLHEIAEWQPVGGGTDLSLPFQWAILNKVVCDAFVIYSDEETWAGQGHAQQWLERYRAEVNPGVKVVVATMTPNAYSVFDTRGDAGVLQIAGLDASLPQVIAAFVQ
jgi:60 kDa SS-A/Ro ribonucleoprotein